MREVVVTGVGVVSSLGIGTAAVRANLHAGRSGITARPDWLAAGLRVGVAGAPPGLDEALAATPQLQRLRLTGAPVAQMCALAAIEAVADAGLDAESLQGPRTACLVGSGIGDAAAIVAGGRLLDSGKPRRIDPYTVVRGMGSAPTAALVALFGLRGRALALSSACATSSHAILFGLELIRHGLADRVLVGGGDAADTYLAAAFDAMRGALATNSNAEPSLASRPFAANRVGFVLASGAAVLVLEARADAVARGARVRARLLGGAAGSDPGDAVLPTADGIAPADTVTAALADASVGPADVDLVFAHATATPAGDRAEVAALRRVFGAQLPHVTAMKSRTGHALGGAGAIDAAIAVFTLEDQVAPATHNACPLDPAWPDLPIVALATAMPIGTVVANAFGFGGALSSLVFGREVAT